MTNTEITGCSDCPFREQHDAISASCHLRLDEVLKMPEAEADGIPNGETPDWCPLRQGPVTILLKSASCPECGVNGYQDGEKLHGTRIVEGRVRVCSKLKG